MGTTTKPTNSIDSWDVTPKPNCSTYGRSYSYPGEPEICHTTTEPLVPTNPNWMATEDPHAKRQNANYIPARSSSAYYPPLLLSQLQGSIINNAEIEEIRNRLNTEQVNWGLNNTSDSLDPAATDTSTGVTARAAGANDLINRIIRKLNNIKTRAGIREYWNYQLDNLSLISEVPVGDEFSAAEWRQVVDRFNTIVNSCVCHRNCSCNWVCNLYQSCRCNSYYKACPVAANLIDDETGGLVNP